MTQCFVSEKQDTSFPVFQNSLFRPATDSGALIIIDFETVTFEGKNKATNSKKPHHKKQHIITNILLNALFLNLFPFKNFYCYCIHSNSPKQ